MSPRVCQRSRWLAVLLAATPAQAAGLLTVGLSDSMPMPLAKLGQHQTPVGLVPDIYQAIGDQLKTGIRFQISSRKRVPWMLQHGQIDLLCHTNPDWLPKAVAQSLAWSAPILNNRDFIVSRAEQPALATLEDLRGHSLGMVAGYIYPQLPPPAELELRTEYANSVPQLLQKLLEGRSDYAITDELSLNWFNRDLSKAKALQPRLSLGQQATRCAVPPHVPPNLRQQILDSIQKLHDSGQLHKLRMKYQ